MLCPCLILKCEHIVTVRNVSEIDFVLESLSPAFTSSQSAHFTALSQQEMEQSMNMLNPNPELPDVSELMTKLFSGSKGSSKAGGSSKGTRPAAKRR